ncbi:arrestin domain-containing protein 3 [Gadus morhua]|nr:arrestin domain-containing protein 3-like [Gadus morhua]
MFGQTIKNFNINFQRRDGSNVYSSGDLMTGKISFELTKECVINSITLTLKGKANVAWRKGGKKRHGVSAKVVYFNFKNVIMMNREAAVQSKFPPGTHVYPFTCQIPQGDFPSSFKGFAGQIAYTLIVGFDRPWHLTKEFETVVNFANRCNLTYELMAPLSGSNSMTVCSLWCASGPISMNVRLERAAFLPGEEVKIMCEFSNSSSRPATTKARLLQKQMFYTLNHGQHRKFEQTLARQTGLVGRHSPEAHSELTITIPSTVPFSISNCAILEVSYVIEVCFSVKYSPDLTVLCPIVIGNLLQDSLAPPPHV